MAQTILVNVAQSVGLYGGISAPMSSEPTTTIMLSDLTITKAADRNIWAAGNLTYTITLTNGEDTPYTDITVSDLLDPTLIQLVEGSVTINGAPAVYYYDNATGLLEIVLPAPLAPSDTTVIRFQVRKA